MGKLEVANNVADILGYAYGAYDEFANTNDSLSVKFGVTGVDILLGVVLTELPVLGYVNAALEAADPQLRSTEDAWVHAAVVDADNAIGTIVQRSGNVLGTVGSALGSIYPSWFDRWAKGQSWLSWLD